MKHTNHKGKRNETHKARPLTTETPFARKRTNETSDGRHESQRDTKYELREQRYTKCRKETSPRHNQPKHKRTDKRSVETPKGKQLSHRDSMGDTCPKDTPCMRHERP